MTKSAPKSLNIAILGGGRIGSALAFQLARTGGHAVTVIARPGSVRLQQLMRDRGVLNVNGERAEVVIADQLDGRAPFDLVIVTLLAHQAASLLSDLRRSAAKAFLFMFNSFEPEPFIEAVGADRCAFGMPFLQSSYDSQGRLDATIGAAGQRSLLSRQSLVDLFNTADVPAAFESNMPLWLRCHAPLCVAFESVCSAGERRGGGCGWGDAESAARGVVEAFALIRALGFTVYPGLKVRLSHAPGWVLAGLLWSISRNKSFRTLLATGRLEGQALTDTMVAAAMASNAPVRVARIEAMRPL